MVYMTAGGLEEARRIARELVESQLAACVNIVDGMHSFYWWEGKIQEDQETILIAKTRDTLVPGLIEKVRALHSYEVPCVVTLPILEGHEPFLKWVHEETREPP